MSQFLKFIYAFICLFVCLIYNWPSFGSVLKQPIFKILYYRICADRNIFMLFLIPTYVINTIGT